MTTEFNAELLKAISNAANRPFSPLAYYDKHMDCIRIELRDCSAFERRLNEHLTIAYDNYPEKNQQSVVGLTIKGVKHFFTIWKIPLEGIYLVTDLLNRLVKEMALDEAVLKDIASVEFIASNIEMPVNLSLAA